MLEILIKIMSPAQVAEAARLAEEWKAGLNPGSIDTTLAPVYETEPGRLYISGFSVLPPSGENWIQSPLPTREVPHRTFTFPPWYTIRCARSTMEVKIPRGW